MINNMKTKVVIVNIERSLGLLSDPARFCSAARLESAAKISHPLRRMQGYAAELALSYALSGDKLLPPVYSYDGRGKPVIGDGFISLSHSGHIAVSAYSDCPVGIDAEAPRDVDPKLAVRMLCPAELRELGKSSDEHYLLRRFVMKEAYLKLTGAGVFGGLGRIFERDGSVFFDGVRAGFTHWIDPGGGICCVVTQEESEIQVIEL